MLLPQHFVIKIEPFKKEVVLLAGSTFGRLFTVTTWGESHGKALGAVIDGCPAGIKICEADIQEDLNRRKPGAKLYSTARKESDAVSILSGVFEGYTTGTPISLIVYNEDQHSHDYTQISEIYRPGHADFTFDQKYGIRDYRGGGRSSGRETVARVAAGAVAKKILASIGISFCTYTKSIGPIEIDYGKFQANEILNNKVCMPDSSAAKNASLYLEDCIKKEDSAGGVVECVITGIPAGLGEPVFHKLDALLGQALFSIGAVKGVEIGIGFESAKRTGSSVNDTFAAVNHNPQKTTNHAGGILGGISDGSPVIVRAAFKPTPSIHKKQQTITNSFMNTSIQINGRHDPVIVPRAVVVVEAMAAITITDLLFQNMHANISHITSFYHPERGK